MLNNYFFPGSTSKPDDVKVHRALPPPGVVVAAEAVHRRLGHRHLVRGAADVVLPGGHLHRVGGHQVSAA